MEDAEVRKLVDRGRVIKEKMDTLDTEQSKIKEKLRAEAKERKVGHFLGDKHFTRISPQTSTECEPKEAYQAFDDLGMEEQFWECCKMLITDTKAKLGESLFGSISFTKSEAYKKVSFLAKAPKKYL